MGPHARTRFAPPKKRNYNLPVQNLRKSVSDDRIIRERSRAFIPVAREPKRNARGALAREETPLLQACRSKDSVNWPGTFKGKTIKNYCPWVHTQKNPGTYCKQKQNNVLVSTACPCACAGY